MSGTPPTTQPEMGPSSETSAPNALSSAPPVIPPPVEPQSSAVPAPVVAIPPPVEPPAVVAVPPPVSPPPPRPNTSSGGGKPPSLVDRMKGNPEGEGAQMSFMDHLLELRSRLWSSLIAIAICMAVAAVFYSEIFAFLRAPLDQVNATYMAQPAAYQKLLDELKLPENTNADVVVAQIKARDPKSEDYSRLLSAIDLTPEASAETVDGQVKKYALSFTDYNNALKTFQLPPRSHLLQITSINMLGTMMMVMWLAIGAGLVISSPIVVYEVWAFVSPGLREKEKKAIQPILFGGIFFFLGGCAITYYMLFPVTLDFSVWLNLRLQVRPLYTVDDYMSLLLNMMWISGLICETPLVIGVLAKLSIVKPEYLTRYWRACFLVSFIFGSVFSPGTDVMSMLVFSALLLVLYGISIFMAYFFYPKQKPAK